MKASASIQKSSNPSARRHSARRTSRSKRTCSVRVGVNAVKSCLPGSARRTGFQRRLVDRMRPPQRAVALERAPGRARQHAVAVRPRRASRRASKPSGSRLGRHHGDIVRQHAVQGAKQRRRLGRLTGNREAHHLPPSMHPGIGAPRHGQRRRGAKHGPKRIEQRLLHRPEPRLNSPPKKLPPVILENQLERPTLPHFLVGRGSRADQPSGQGRPQGEGVREEIRRRAPSDPLPRRPQRRAAKRAPGRPSRDESLRRGPSFSIRV